MRVLGRGAIVMHKTTDFLTSILVSSKEKAEFNVETVYASMEVCKTTRSKNN